MPARGQTTGTIYREEEIFPRYFEMKQEVLRNEGGGIVFPIRLDSKPHFREMTKGYKETRVGKGERNPQHELAIEKLMAQLRDNRLVLQTRQFVSREEHYEENIFVQPAGMEYIWRAGEGCRITTAQGFYIHPDICGRSENAVFPQSGEPSIIIEVIKTHEPELETFKYLLELSARQCIVIFFFLDENGEPSAYNRTWVAGGTVTITAAYYLAQGHAMKNFQVRDWIKPGTPNYERDWKNYFKTPKNGA